MGEALGCISREEDKDTKDVPLKSKTPFPNGQDYSRGQEKFGCVIGDMVTWVYHTNEIPKGERGKVIGFDDTRVRVQFSLLTSDFDPQEIVKDSDNTVMPSHLMPATAGNFGDPTESARDWNMSSRSMGSATASARWTATARNQARESGRAALARLREGNLKYLSGTMQQREFYPEDDRPEPCAIICCCTPLPAPADVIFGVSSDEIACITSASLDYRLGDDGSAAALEYSMATTPEVHLMVVIEILGSSDKANQATADAWAAVEQILRHSETVRGHMRRGAMFVHAALLELGTGQVRFLGEHSNQAKLIATPRGGGGGASAPMTSEMLSKGPVQPGVPPEEALAILQCGNVRAAGKTVHAGRAALVTPRTANTDEGEHDPYAMVFMMFDPHKGTGPLLELIFDTHPSQLATMSLVPEEYHLGPNEKPPTVDELWDGYMHWAEYCLTEHTTKLLLVLGSVSENATQWEIQSVKDEVFANMLELMKRSKLVKAGVADGLLQVEGAVYFGANQAPPGHVEWLGTHPEQFGCVQTMRKLGTPINSSMSLSAADLPKASGGVESSYGYAADRPTWQMVGEDDGMSSRVVRDLAAGNQRYMASGLSPLSRWRPDYLPKIREKGAKAIVLSAANGAVRAPEYLFDATPGELLVHRTCGAISGRRDGCALTYLEKMVRRHPEVRLLLIVGDVLDPVVGTAAAQVQLLSNQLRPANAQMVVEQLGPAVVHAWRQMRPETSDSQQQSDLVAHATELHVVYVLERILRDSDFILDLVKNRKLDVQGAIAEADGTVRFVGGHTDVSRLLEQQAQAERHRRKGLGLGPGRKNGRSP